MGFKNSRDAVTAAAQVEWKRLVGNVIWVVAGSSFRALSAMQEYRDFREVQMGEGDF